MIGPSLCPYCAHNRHDGTCDAFPTGIPVAISAGGFDHRGSYAGEDVQFAPAEGVTQAEVDEALR